jgi:L-cysteine desulfidase
MDVCAIPASSVPCERLFSAGAEIATDRRSRLGSDKFEQLQVLKHAWRDSIVDMATANSSIIEQVKLQEFVELMLVDNAMVEWDQDEGELVVV